MDKRKNNGNKGHSTKSDNVDRRVNKFKDAVSNACTEDDVINVLQMLYKQSIEKQDTKAAQLFLSYCIGRPTETKNITLENAVPIIDMNEWK